MIEPNYSHDAIPTVWVVERVDIDGEELPVIRHAETWLPAPLALRYMLRTRFRLGANALTSEMRSIAHAYNWCEANEEIGNLEMFLTGGNYPSRDQLQRLIPFLHRRHGEIAAVADCIVGGAGTSSLVSNQTFNSRLFAIQQFLEWAIEPTNHGGECHMDEDTREVRTAKTLRLFEKARLPVGGGSRHEPLTVAEIRLIRQAIGPDEFGEFPPGVFEEGTRYRNWTMFETSLNLGTRKGELMTIKVIHLPTGGDEKRILVPRQQDAAEDPRKRRRLRGKTNERLVPLMDPAFLPSLLRYRDAKPPLGRNDPRITTPYLFVTGDGQPLSNSTADYIIKSIGKYAVRLLDQDKSMDEHERARLRQSMLRLNWHRIRHTWAEQAALELYRMYGEGAWHPLQEWGGWNNPDSMERYIQYARRAISERATREYQETLVFRSQNR